MVETLIKMTTCFDDGANTLFCCYFVVDAAHVGVHYDCEKVESKVSDAWISGCVNWCEHTVLLLFCC